MKFGRETSILEVNRNTVAKIISLSVKSGKAVDFKYPLDTFYVQFYWVLPFQMEVNDQQEKANF